MVLENTDDNVLKVNPLGMEAPYSDWKMSDEDLVNYQDRDARGLDFVFSVERLSDNPAMQKFVSVYQKPSDDGTGGYVVVSMSPINPNDIRIYEISNTTYGNEPNDPQLFLQKVIEMADGSGMLRNDDYGNYHLETADNYSVQQSSSGSGYGVSARKKGRGSSVTYKQQGFNTNGNSTANSTGNSTANSTGNSNVSYGKTNIKSVNNNPNTSQPKYKNLGSANQKNSRVYQNKQGATIQKHIGTPDDLSSRFQEFKNSLPGGPVLGTPEQKSASIITNYGKTVVGDDPKKQQLVGDIIQGVKGMFGVNGKIGSTAQQIKEKIITSKNKSDKETFDDDDEVGVKPKEYVSPFSSAAGAVSGGIMNALSKTTQGGIVGLNPYADAVRGINNAKRQNVAEDKRYQRDSLRAQKVNYKESKKVKDSNLKISDDPDGPFFKNEKSRRKK